MAHVFVFCCGVFVGTVLGVLCTAMLVISGDNICERIGDAE